MSTLFHSSTLSRLVPRFALARQLARPLPAAWMVALPLLAGAALQVHAQALVDGDVVKIDKNLGKITLNHGEIKNIDLPPMKTAFHVKDRAALDRFAVGDRVRFAVEKLDGQYTITTITPAK